MNLVAHISIPSSSLVVDGKTWGDMLTSFIPGRGFVIIFHRLSRNRAVNRHFGRFPPPLWEPHRCPACRVVARWKLQKLPGDDELPESWRWRATIPLISTYIILYRQSKDVEAVENILYHKERWLNLILYNQRWWVSFWIPSTRSRIAISEAWADIQAPHNNLSRADPLEHGNSALPNLLNQMMMYSTSQQSTENHFFQREHYFRLRYECGIVKGQVRWPEDLILCGKFWRNRVVPLRVSSSMDTAGRQNQFETGLQYEARCWWRCGAS